MVSLFGNQLYLGGNIKFNPRAIFKTVKTLPLGKEPFFIHSPFLRGRDIQPAKGDGITDWIFCIQPHCQ